MALVRVASLERLDDLADLIEVVQSGEPIAVPVGAAAGRIAAGDDLALKKNKLAKPEAAVSAARGPAGTSSASTARAAQSFSSGGSNPGFTGGSRFGGDPNSAFLQSAAEDGEEEDDAGVYQGASSAARSSLRREPSQTPVSPSPAPSLRSSDSNSSTAAELGAALTAENAAGVWEAALAKLEGIAADQGSLCRSVANIGPNHLVVSFGKKYTFCKDLCERPDQKSRIEAALAEVTGQRVRLDFAIVDDMPDQTSGANKPKSVSLRQFQSEVAARPLVRRALELFDAENPRIDAPESS